MAESVTKAFLGQKLAAATCCCLKCPVKGHDEAVSRNHCKAVCRLNDMKHFSLTYIKSTGNPSCAFAPR